MADDAPSNPALAAHYALVEMLALSQRDMKQPPDEARPEAGRGGWPSKRGGA